LDNRLVGDPLPTQVPVEPDDTSWVEACRGGDRNAFRVAVERYQQRAYRVALRLLGDPAAAQDAAQESLFKAYRALDRYDTSRPFLTWLLRIVVNTSLDAVRRRREHPSSELDELEGNSTADGALAATQTREAVNRALARLPEEYRTALVLKDVEGLDYETISEIVGDSVAALKIRVIRGRAKLADRIEKMYPGLLTDV
jgi:RNA polymerase sigma-70 factor (ECF subfamily)